MALCMKLLKKLPTPQISRSQYIWRHNAHNWNTELIFWVCMFCIIQTLKKLVKSYWYLESKRVSYFLNLTLVNNKVIFQTVNKVRHLVNYLPLLICAWDGRDMVLKSKLLIWKNYSNNRFSYLYAPDTTFKFCNKINQIFVHKSLTLWA